tara:strand:+ start:173 stop:418 length:246 start_codon:yes stop_codon:yes gene_type:complete
MITKDYDDLFDRVRGNLGEHFSNYMFIVMDDDGELFYDYTNHRVGRMLVAETRMDMEADRIEIWWEDPGVDEDEEEGKGVS